MRLCIDDTELRAAITAADEARLEWFQTPTDEASDRVARERYRATLGDVLRIADLTLIRAEPAPDGD